MAGQREGAPLRLSWLPAVGLGSGVSRLGGRPWRLSRREHELDSSRLRLCPSAPLGA